MEYVFYVCGGDCVPVFYDCVPLLCGDGVRVLFVGVRV